MAIALGRTISHPSFILLQIIYAVSLFFAVLGLVRLLLGVFTVYVNVMFFSGYYYSSMWRLVCYNIINCLHISLASLFSGPIVHQFTLDDGISTKYAESSKFAFFCMHVFTALGVFYPLALQLQRRKMLLDFVGTIYAVYGLFAMFVLRRFIWSIQWWLTIMFSFATLFALTWYTCRHLELEIITVGNNNANTNTGNTTGGNTTNNHSSSGNNNNTMSGITNVSLSEMSQQGAKFIWNWLPRQIRRTKERTGRDAEDATVLISTNTRE